MLAHCAYAVFTRRREPPPETLLAAADVPALDPAVWRLTAIALDDGHASDEGNGMEGEADAPLREVLSTLAFEREPPISRRAYPPVRAFRQAVLVEVERADSLYPDALGFAVGAVSALVRWADGAVVDLSAERLWLAKEWDKKLARQPFDPRKHISIHASWAANGRSATLHTHGMAKFAHPEFVAFDVPDEGTRAVGQLLGHLASVRARTLEPLGPGHAFDPGFGQPMVAFLDAPPDHPVVEHLGAAPSVVVDFDVETGEAVEGLYTLLATAKALDRSPPENRARRPLVAP